MHLNPACRLALAACLTWLLAFAPAARAESEFNPPAGKGRLVVVVSGAFGASTYQPPARRIAALGYDVILLDGHAMTSAATLRAAITGAQASPHALPGKVGVAGFSMGGGELLRNATAWPDLVAVALIWYPVTSGINDAASFVRGVKVPVLMFAGEADQLSSHCCTIKAARDLGAAAAAAGLPFELVTYRGAGHDFVLEGLHSYDADAAADSWRRAAAKLAEYLGP